ncbi:hypothetical protein M8818_000984 [Zalaria obscura]|uniref:Uncharacterized protein n=1 Tax=Zalaria obscura TaxID=2024903 RepID=A0ACC3SLT6_9PEZI
MVSERLLLHIHKNICNSNALMRRPILNSMPCVKVTLSCTLSAHPGVHTQSSSSRLGWNGVGFPFGTEWCRVLGVDLEEMIEDDKEHGSTSEEDRKGIEAGVRDHYGGRLYALVDAA